MLEDRLMLGAVGRILVRDGQDGEVVTERQADPAVLGAHGARPDPDHFPRRAELVEHR